METALVQRTVALQNSFFVAKGINVGMYKVKDKKINSQHLSAILDALSAFVTQINRTTEH